MKRLDDAHPGVVHEHVDRTERGFYIVHKRAHRFRITHIARMANGLDPGVSQLRDGFGDGSSPAAADGDGVPGMAKRDCGRSPDARGRPRDQRHAWRCGHTL